MNDKSILVVGLGYIGLPLALRLAEIGNTVYGEDIDDDRCRCIEDRVSPWPDEPMIANRLEKTTMRLWAGDLYDTIIFCIPVDTDDCKQLSDEMLDYDLEDKLVIIESTLPLLGTDKIKKILPASAKFAYCPERLSSGKLWWNLLHLPRVIGGDSTALDIYRDVTYGYTLHTDLRTAELVKLTENAYRYKKLTFANDLALKCQNIPDGDAWQVVDILGKMGISIPNPGAGIGGYCLGKDTDFLNLPYCDEEEYLWEMTYMISKYARDGLCVMLGGAYKPDVSDTRNSPGVAIARELMDSYAIETNLLDQTIDIPDCDVLTIAQRHSIYKTIDWAKVKAKVVVDLCGFFQLDMELPNKRAWKYVCLGISQDAD